MCKVTIVTVCYNAKDTIAATMRSVLKQTYDNIEYILIDGKSTDGTIEEIDSIRKEYPNRCVRVQSAPDQGIYDAMNKGIDKASGDWINFMNAGDRFASNSVLEKFLPYFVTENDVLFGNTLLVKTHGVKRQKGVLKEGEFPSLVHQSVFVKTYLMKLYHFEMQYKISADFGFLYKLYLQGKNFHYVDIDVALYDLSGISSNHREQLYREHCKIRQEKPSKIKLAKYKIEDSLPNSLMRKIVEFKDYLNGGLCF